VDDAAKEVEAEKAAEGTKTPKEKRAEDVKKAEAAAVEQDAEEAKQTKKEDAAAAAEDADEASKEEKFLSGWHDHAKKNYVHVDLETYAAGLPGKWLK